MKIEIDKKILENIKEDIIKYLIRVGFIKNSQEERFIRNNLNAVKNLYVENLEEKFGTHMVSRKDSIAIDQAFVIFNSDGTKVLGFKKEYYELIISQLGHELWHNASNSNDIHGIIVNNHNKRFLALNEGITQLLAEDISGFTLSKYSDKTYRYFKYIAKILRLSTSNEILLRSYLYHTDDLKNSCNALANDPEFYDQFNEYLSNLLYLKKIIIRSYKAKKIEKPSDDYDKAFNFIYRNRIVVQYKSLILNIVIPKLKTLNEKQKKIYIENILNIFKEDYEVYKIVSEYLMEVISLNDAEINKRKQQLNKMNQVKEEQRVMLERFAIDAKTLYEKGFIKVKQDGTVTYNIQGREIVISIEPMKSMIYQQLWLIEKKGKYDIKSKLEYFLKNGLDVPKELSVLKRRRFFCAIKYYLEKEGYFVLNSYEEIDNVDKFNFHVLKKLQMPTLNELKEVLKHFKLESIIDENGKLEKKVINIKTNNITNDPVIVRTVLFVYLLLNSYNKTLASNFKEIDESFYNDLVSIMKNGLLTTGNLELDKIISKYKNTKYYDVITKLFKSKRNYEVIYNFVLTYINDGDKNNVVLQTRKEKSFDEIMYGDFEVRNDVESIMNKLI